MSEGNHDQALEIRQVVSQLEGALAEFFAFLNTSGDEVFFHPHDFNEEAAEQIATYKGKDLYYVLLLEGKVLGYGMLRGWDEGYEIPSLGIIIHPAARGKGLGRLLMVFLHSAACMRGCKKIRLKVYPENRSAVQLYQQLGYEFLEETENQQLVGYYKLID
jgi:ribosomal protein S18 acetylase RimI-like enzyme